MSRIMAADWITAATTTPCWPVLLFKGVFVSSTIYLWTGPGSIVFGGNTHVSNGYFLAEDSGGDTQDIKAVGLKVSLSGVPLSQMSFALAQPGQNLNGTLWLGFYPPGGPLATPYEVYSGRLDQVNFVETVKGTVIQIDYESRLIDMHRVIPWRYTSMSQGMLYAGDKGFDFVEVLDNQGVDFFWGKPGPKIKAQRTKHRRGGSGHSGGGGGFQFH